MTAVALLWLAGCGGPNGPTPPIEAPSITCPAAVSVSGVVGGSQPVSYNSPTVTGGTQPVSVACSPASGAAFPVGATTVSCTATDASSRSAQCTFTVSLTAALRLAVTKFLAFGDSLTEGENGRFAILGLGFIDPSTTYPARLEVMLNAEYAGQPITVVNRGISGKDVDTLRQRLPDELRSVRPDAVLLLGGYNDLLAWCRPQDASTAKCGSTTTEVAAGMRKMVVSSKEAGLKYVFVSTLTPPGPYLGVGKDRRIAGSAIVTTNGKIVNMVRAEGVTLVDPYPVFLGHEAEYVDQDGLHLRPAGYQALAETFFAAIKSTISSTPAFRGEF